MERARYLIVLTIGLVLGGCSAASPLPDNGSVKTGTYEQNLNVDGFQRSYLVHVPPGYDSSVAMPAVIMLHGGGGNAENTIKQTGWAAKSDSSGFIAVFPNALPPNPSRRSSFVFNPQLWNDGSDRFYPEHTERNDVSYLLALVSDLKQHLKIDERRVYLTGFSNGASMTFLAAAELPDLFAAIAPVAGACWIEPDFSKISMSMLYLTGTADPLNPIDGGIPKLASGSLDAVRAKPKPHRESLMLV